MFSTNKEVSGLTKLEKQNELPYVHILSEIELLIRLLRRKPDSLWHISEKFLDWKMHTVTYLHPAGTSVTSS